MRLIDQLTNHPLLEERPIKHVFEPLGFEIHIETHEVPDPDDEPKEHERYLSDIDGYMDSLPFKQPQGFTGLGRWESEDGHIVMLAVKPTTALAEALMAPAPEMPGAA